MPCVYHEVLLTASLLVRTVCVQRHGRAGGLPSHGVSCQKTQTGISQQTVLVTKTGNFTRIGRYTLIATFPLPLGGIPAQASLGICLGLEPGISGFGKLPEFSAPYTHVPSVNTLTLGMRSPYP